MMGEILLDLPPLWTFTAQQRDQALCAAGSTCASRWGVGAGAASMLVLVRDGDSGDSGTVTVSLRDLPGIR